VGPCGEIRVEQVRKQFHPLYYSRPGPGVRHLFLHILEQTVRRYGWLLHAWVQMTNHDHLLVETPQANVLSTADTPLDDNR